MKLIIIPALILVGFLASCETKKETKKTENKTNTTEEVTISFCKKNGEDQQIINSTGPSDFLKYVNIVNTSLVSENKCGYTGNIRLKNLEGEEVDCLLKLDDNFNHIIYNESDKIVTRELTKEGRKTLLALIKKEIINSPRSESTKRQNIESPEIKAYNLTGLFNENMLPHIRRLHPDFYRNGQPDWVNLEYEIFRPNETSEYYIFIQVTLNKNNMKFDVFGYFYPDKQGKYRPENYILLLPDENPCENCDLKEIKSYNQKKPVGIFVDRTTLEEVKFDLGYNLDELYFYWIN